MLLGQPELPCILPMTGLISSTIVVRTLLLRRARQSPADTRLLLEAILLALGLVARILDGFHFVPVLAHQRRVQRALWQDV